MQGLIPHPYLSISFWAVVLFGLSACSNIPLPDAPPNIKNWNVIQSGEKKALLELDANDTDGRIEELFVDWGDGNSETLETDGKLSAEHNYAEEGNYQVSIVVRDDDNDSASASMGVHITTAIEACMQIEGVIDVCGITNTDFKHFRVTIVVIGIEIAAFTLDITQAEIVIPFGILDVNAGSVTVKLDIDERTIRFTGELCVPITGPCIGAFDQTLEIVIE